MDSCSHRGSIYLEDEEMEEISFSNKSSSYCVCFVSMVDSLEFTFQIKDAKNIRKYYSIFINTMAAIARNFRAKIIKNTGTSLVYFFQKHLLLRIINLLSEMFWSVALQ